MPDKTIETVLHEQTDRLMALSGVVGVAQGEVQGRPAIIVMVGKKTPALTTQIPAVLDGYTVVVEETGEFQALDAE